MATVGPERIVDRHQALHMGSRVRGRIPQLVGVYLAETLVALNFDAGIVRALPIYPVALRHPSMFQAD